MLLRIDQFKGEIPILRPQKLPVGAAVSAKNCRFDSGSIDPYYTPDYETMTVQAGCKTLYYEDESDVWLKFDGIVDHVPSFAVGTKLVIYTDGILPKQTKPALWGTASPRKLGITGPSTPLVASGYNPGSATINSSTPVLQSVAYVCTYVDDLDQESKPSPVKGIYNIYDIASGYGLTISSFPAPTGITGVNRIRLYRLQSGTIDAEYMFLAEIAVDGSTNYSTLTYLDYDTETKTVKACQTDALVTTNWDAPPSSLVGIRLLANGMIGGYVQDKNILCISETFIPYAFPEKYKINLPTSVRDTAVFGEVWLVLTWENAYSVTGMAPDAMSVNPIPGGIGCVSLTKRATIEFEGGVLYPGASGLIHFNGAQCNCITDTFIPLKKWQEMQPHLFIGAYYEGKYWAFKEGLSTGYIIDFKKGEVSQFDTGFAVYGAYVSSVNRLWVIGSGTAKRWDSSGFSSPNYPRLSAWWESGAIPLSAPVNFSAAMVVSEQKTGSVTFTLWKTNGETKEEVVSRSVYVNKPFRLPGGYMSDSISVRTIGTVTVNSIRLATSIQELGNGQ